MATPVILEKKEGDGRLWLHTRAPLTIDPSTWSYRLPLDVHPTKRKARETTTQVWHIRLRSEPGLFDLLKELSKISGLSRVTVSQYTISIDKQRAFTWAELIDPIVNALNRTVLLNLLDVQGRDAFLVAVGEKGHPASCPMCGALTPGGPDAFDPGSEG